MLKYQTLAIQYELSRKVRQDYNGLRKERIICFVTAIRFIPNSLVAPLAPLSESTQCISGGGDGW